MPAPERRRKLSTTISENSYKYLTAQVETGRATSLAEAVDRIVECVRRLENRAKLRRDTAAYFQNLSVQAAAEERQLEAALGQAANEVNFER